MRGGPRESNEMADSKGLDVLGREFSLVSEDLWESWERIAGMHALSGRSMVDGKLVVHSSREDRMSSVDPSWVLSVSGHDGFSASGRRVLVIGDGVRFCSAGAARSGDIGGLDMARSRRRLGKGAWNLLLKEGSREGALELSPSAGVTGGDSE